VENEAARELLAQGFVALTGAGMSTDSGIPDYRGPGSRNRNPMTIAEFRSGAAQQQRYWARSHIGWQRMGRALPNAGHRALAELEARGLCRFVITQNVDGLHEAAGSRHIVALHGRVSQVVCLACGDTTDRAHMQRRLDEANPGWIEAHADVASRPDGDVDLEQTVGFVVPTCERCGGVLKPHVVFFGENADRDDVRRCFAAVEEAPALLVLGTSLTVMSGLRFVRAAARQGTPVVIVNRGVTRGDELATVKLEEGASEFLTALLATPTSGRVTA
jgi:NAD-dependent SIR2 family protein deacetylase